MQDEGTNHACLNVSTKVFAGKQLPYYHAVSQVRLPEMGMEQDKVAFGCLVGHSFQCFVVGQVLRNQRAVCSLLMPWIALALAS